MPNPASPGKVSRWLPRLYAGFFSLNLAWALVWPAREGSKTLGGPTGAHLVLAFFGWAYQLVSPIGGFTILEQLTWTMILASVILLLLRMCSPFVNMTIPLLAVAGLICIAAFPLSTRLSLFLHPLHSGLDYQLGLELELAVVLICAAIYVWRKQRPSHWLMLMVLLFHFVLWAWATSSYFNFLQIDALRASEYYHPWRRTFGVLGFGTAFHFGFPVLGFLASATWVLSLREHEHESAQSEFASGALDHNRRKRMS